MSLLSVKDASFIYSQKTPFQHTAVDHVSFDVEQGDFIGIIGHTGSGKSTLVQMLNGLLKPTSGSVILDGIDIWDKPKEIRKIRFRVGLVFQYPEYQLFEETVEKDISFGPMNMGLSENEIKERVLSAAQFVGLDPELLQKSPFDLSGGEKRRAAIAGVIAMDPDILILDEPCAGLDPLGRDVLLTQIYRYHQQRGNTVLLVSHSMEDVAAVCDKALVMDHSHLQMIDSCEHVFSQGDRLAEMGLRIPQITSIVDSLIDAGYPLQKGTLTVEKAFSISKTTYSGVEKFFHWAVTFALICFAWILFRANNLSEAVLIITGIFTQFGDPKPETANFIAIGLALTIMFGKELSEEIKWPMRNVVSKSWLVCHIYLVLMIAYIILFGVLGGDQFIYFQF